MHDPARQQTLTAVVPLVPVRSAELVSAVAARDAALKAAFARVTTLHSAQLVLLPADAGANSAELLFTTTFDGGLGPHLAELWAEAGAELECVFHHCAGWSAPSDAGRFGRFLMTHLCAASAVFGAQAGRSVAQIRAEARSRSELAALFEQVVPYATLAASGAAVALSPRGVALAEAVRLGLLFLRSVLADSADWFRALWHDVAPRRPPLGPRPLEVTHGVRRGFAHVARVKPGRFRRRALRSALAWLRDYAERATARGVLGGLGAVHAARWVELGDGRLVFTGEYDGSLEALLGAAVERHAAALDRVWSHTEHFPAGLGWSFAGARHYSALRDFVRAGELVTLLCYSAYPRLGADEIRQNAELARWLERAPDERSAGRGGGVRGA